MKTFILLLLSFIALAFSKTYDASVKYSNGQYSLVDGIDKTAAAYGSFADDLDVNGWGVFKVQTNSQYSSRTQMHAAGYLEGALTRERIYQNYQNMYGFFFKDGKKPSQKLFDFLEKQNEWVGLQIARRGKHDPTWQGISFIMSQFNGLVQGYNETTSKSQALPLFAFQLLNGVGDFLDLLKAIDVSERPNFDKMTEKELSMWVAKSGHCSSLIKLNGDMSELYAGHSSWFTYGAMNRIYKHYYFDLQESFVAAKAMSFSSYPGFLESLDDFYMMDSGLVMTQTTNNVFNMSLYDLVKPESLWAWQRVRLANMLSRTGFEWGEHIRRYNSGTYNNQYMVTNYNLFTPGLSVAPGTLVVTEQIPGLVEFADMTPQLERGYWASYNVPYFPKVYELSGYPEIVKKNGPSFSYQMAPRAEIFRRDQGKIVDFQDYKNMLRYNDYLVDPYSNKNPGAAICSRFDLDVNNPQAFGCIDTKVTNQMLHKYLIAEAVNGPTRSSGLPAFSWKPIFNATSHVGEPNTYDFDFVTMDPKWDQSF